MSNPESQGRGCTQKPRLHVPTVPTFESASLQNRSETLGKSSKEFCPHGIMCATDVFMSSCMHLFFSVQKPLPCTLLRGVPWPVSVQVGSRRKEVTPEQKGSVSLR